RPSGETAARPSALIYEFSGGWTKKRTEAALAGTWRLETVSRTRILRDNTATRAQLKRQYLLLPGIPSERNPACEPPLAIHFSSSRRSRADCQRSSASFARQTRMARSSAGGVRGCELEIGGGSRSKIAAITLACVFPSNAFFPVAISYSTDPKANMSLRA